MADGRLQRRLGDLPRSVWWLIAVNLVPLLGVVFLGWDLGLVMLLFWAESGVIGFYNLLKIAVVGKWAALFMGPFFTVHYGGFMLGHLVFIIALFFGNVFGDSEGGSILDELEAIAGELALVVALLFASHGYSFVTNFLPRAKAGEAEELGKLMMRPYARIVVMHLTIIFGAFLIVALGEPAAALGLLVVLKIIADAFAHLREHRAQDGTQANPEELEAMADA